jgi:3-hydroxy-9,10-secoandrosta-1,3,5(10)-triene-9,17-dione monooxygenase
VSLVERARELRPLLEREAEADGLFDEAGFYLMLVPARYGGVETAVPTFLRVVLELARGCPASAARLSHAAGPALQVATLLSEEAQDEIFGHGAPRWAAGVEPAGTARRLDGGWEVSGTFAGLLGAADATHLLGQALALEQGAEDAPMPIVFVASRGQWTALGDGEGPSLRFDGAVIPDHLVLEDVSLLDVDVSERTPGYRLHGTPLYAGRSMAFFQAQQTAVLVGGAVAAVDEYERLVRTEQTPLPPRNPRRLDPDYQRWLGTAIGRVTAAELLLEEVAEQYVEACAGIERGEPFSREADLRLTAMAREAAKLARSAVDDVVVRTAGSGAMQPGERIERITRDLPAGLSHPAIPADEDVARRLARERLGLQVAG